MPEIPSFKKISLELSPLAKSLRNEMKNVTLELLEQTNHPGLVAVIMPNIMEAITDVSLEFVAGVLEKCPLSPEDRRKVECETALNMTLLISKHLNLTLTRPDEEAPTHPASETEH